MHILITWFFNFYLWPILKWFLRQTTGLCELQRISYGNQKGAPRTKAVETCLQLSKSNEIIKLLYHLNDIADNQRFTGPYHNEIIESSINTVMLVKKINPKIHRQFVINFGDCIEQIWGYRQLLSQVECLRATIYDSSNNIHEAKLLQLWDGLMPNEPLEARVCKQWQEIGFQGDDPKTDFRGMGLLGLENLLGFVTEHRQAANLVLSHSHHPKYGYTFAIVGINLTSLAYNLMKQGEAKTFFYNNRNRKLDLSLFHQFYSYLFFEFDKYWIDCKPKDIMEFSTIRESFENNIRLALQDSNSLFRINLNVDII